LPAGGDDAHRAAAIVAFAKGDCVIDNVDLVDGIFVLTIRNARDCLQDPTFPSCQ